MEMSWHLRFDLHGRVDDYTTLRLTLCSTLRLEVCSAAERVNVLFLRSHLTPWLPCCLLEEYRIAEKLLNVVENSFKHEVFIAVKSGRVI